MNIFILIFFFLAFVFQFIFNSVLNVTIMIKTPVDKRGKVSATKATLCMAMSPLGNFIGGLLCERFDARLLIIISAITALVIVGIIVTNPNVKGFLNEE